MDYLILILIALSLSIDAFSVSICDGMVMSLNYRKRFFIAGTFGIMQGVMPLIGYFLGSLFVGFLSPYDGILSFVLLLVIGIKMIVDACKNQECSTADFSVSTVLLQGVATSIDALAVGVTLLSMSVIIWVAAAVIAAVTFILSLIALICGEKLVKLFKGRSYIAQIIGGAVLILIGVKILIESFI